MPLQKVQGANSLLYSYCLVAGLNLCCCCHVLPVPPHSVHKLYPQEQLVQRLLLFEDCVLLFWVLLEVFVEVEAVVFSAVPEGAFDNSSELRNAVMSFSYCLLYIMITTLTVFPPPVAEKSCHSGIISIGIVRSTGDNVPSIIFHWYLH